MKTTIKIALSCFLGGVVFGLFARVLTPNFWYLGILTGAIAGYLSYEFRRVLQAIPQAFIAVGKGSNNFFNETFWKIKEYFKEPHPFKNSGIAITLIPASYLIARFVNLALEAQKTDLAVLCVICVVAILFFAFLIGLVVGAILYATAYEAAHNLDCAYWDTAFERKENKHHLWECGNNPNLTEKPLTLLNAWRWIFMGVIWLIRMLAVGTVWHTPKYLLIGIYKSIFFITGFVKHLFILIHSQERIICALDGTLGGLFAYFLLGPKANGLTETITFIVFGGIIGVAFGVMNYEIVSKRWLKIVPVKK